MRVVIDDEPSNPLTSAQERDISLWTKKDSFQGSLLQADEATRAYIGKTRWLYVAAAGGFFAVGGALALLAEPFDRMAAFAGVTVISLLVAAALFLLLRRRARVWNERMARRLAGLTPSSGKLGFSTSGLCIGDRVLPWATLEIEQVDFVQFSVGQAGGRSARMYIIERLSLGSPCGPVVLDTAMMRSGRLIVDNVWRRLRLVPASTA